METGVFERIRALLDGRGADFRLVEHEPTRTSEESAAARGEELRVGGKALVVRADERFALVVLRAIDRLHSPNVRRRLGSKKLRFATREELAELTGLVPGSVPPFGQPVLELELFADELLLENERIAFNAGSLTRSIVMSTRDWRAIAEPTIGSFAKPATPR